MARGKGGFNPAHSDMSLTDGKAGPGKEPGPPAVQRADGETLPCVSSGVACRPSGTHRYTGGSSGIQVGQLERTRYSNPQEERGRTGREERGRAVLTLLSTGGYLQKDGEERPVVT